MADSLKQQQQRVLLQQMAQGGAEARQLFDEQAAQVKAQRQEALQRIAAQRAAGGAPQTANDEVGFYDRRLAGLSQQSASAEHQAQARQQALGDYQSQIDQGLTAAKSWLDVQAQRKAAETAATKDPYVEAASRMRAQQYLADPYGEQDAARKRDQAQYYNADYDLARAAQISPEGSTEGTSATQILSDMRQSPSYGTGSIIAREVAKAGGSASQLRDQLTKNNVPEPIALLLLAEYQQQNAAPYRAPSVTYVDPNAGG